jgi:hypothetical protein
MKKRRYINHDAYKEAFKRNELEHELQDEDREYYESMTPEERRKAVNEEAKAQAYRDMNPWPKR